MLRSLHDAWRKNGPELIAAMTRGLPRFVVGEEAPRLQGIPVFCYHVVEHPAFESHLRFLRENEYHALTADELLTHILGGETNQGGPAPIARPDGRSTGGGRSVVLTFDDGHSSLFDVAYPLLREYGLRAVAFIAPAFHGDADAARTFPTCSWGQIEEMHGSGRVDFQSHTLEHRLVRAWPRGSPLTGMTAEDCERFRGPPLRMVDDFARAREIIEKRLGKRVRHLAFPQYDDSPEAVCAAHAAGYQALYGGVRPHRPLNVVGGDPFRIVRLSGEFLPRLPGRGRVSLGSILRDRYARNLRRWTRRGGAPEGSNGRPSDNDAEPPQTPARG